MKKYCCASSSEYQIITGRPFKTSAMPLLNFLCRLWFRGFWKIHDIALKNFLHGKRKFLHAEKFYNLDLQPRPHSSLHHAVAIWSNAMAKSSSQNLNKILCSKVFELLTARSDVYICCSTKLRKSRNKIFSYLPFTFGFFLILLRTNIFRCKQKQ